MAEGGENMTGTGAVVGPGRVYINSRHIFCDQGNKLFGPLSEIQ